MLFVFFLSLYLYLAKVSYGDDHDNDDEAPYVPTTRNDFQQFQNSLPVELLKEPLAQQETLLNLIDLYLLEKEKIFPYEIFRERRDRALNYASFTTHVDIGVIFLGFPANSLPRMREMWFDQLSRIDHIRGVTSSQEDILHIPGRVHIKQKFHVIETSLHLETALIKYINQLAYPKSSNSNEYYFKRKHNRKAALKSDQNHEHTRIGDINNVEKRVKFAHEIRAYVTIV